MEAGEDRASHTILIVEDEPAVRMMTADILRDEGYQVIETGTASEAMVVLSSQPIDLVLSDVLMPGSIGGLTLAGWIKSARPAIPVILCSGINAVSRYLHGRQGVTFLAKPFGTDDLLSLVSRLLTSPVANGGAR